MPATGSIVHYLQLAAEAEQTFERQLRDFAGAASDDAEVQAVFSAHADETAAQRERLLHRLGELDVSAEASPENPAALLNVAPSIAQASAVPEERQLQNLLAGYAVEAGETAFYERLAQTARAFGDLTTESLARRIQAEEQATAEKLWHFIPTRSKIAFNMLTVSELDPAVETKLADDRIES